METYRHHKGQILIPSGFCSNLNGLFATRLGPLHDRDPLLVVTEEGEIEVRRSCVRLRTDGQLREDALPREQKRTSLGAEKHSSPGFDSWHYL